MSDEIREGANSIVLECDFEERPETVWKALAEPELAARWLLPDGVPSHQDHRLAFEDEEAGGSVQYELLEAEPHRLVRYGWRVEDGSDRPLDSIVTFVLSETAVGGTHLRLIHSGLAGAAAGLVQEFRTIMSAAVSPGVTEQPEREPAPSEARPPTTSLYGWFRSAA